MSILVSGSTVQLNETVQVLSKVDFSSSQTAHLNSNVGNLILSSTTGVVFLSAALNLRTGTGGRTAIDSNQITFTSSAAALWTRFGVATPYYSTYNVAVVDGVNNDIMSVRVSNATLNLYSNGDLELNPSVGSSTNRTLKFSGSNKNNTLISALGGHLILTSVNSGTLKPTVAISGCLKVDTFATTGSLPANAETGSIVYLNDVQCFAGYGSRGWVPFLTGSPFVLA